MGSEELTYMPNDIYDAHVKRLTAAIYKALDRPELLGYMRKQLIKDFIYNLNNMTTTEIDTYLEKLKVLNNATEKET